MVNDALQLRASDAAYCCRQAGICTRIGRSSIELVANEAGHQRDIQCHALCVLLRKHPALAKCKRDAAGQAFVRSEFLEGNEQFASDSYASVPLSQATPDISCCREFAAKMKFTLIVRTNVWTRHLFRCRRMSKTSSSFSLDGSLDRINCDQWRAFSSELNQSCCYDRLSDAVGFLN